MKDYCHQLEMRNKKKSETMAASSSALFLAMRNGEDHIKSKQHHSAGPSSSSAAPPPPPDQQQKRKRNQPGAPNLEAEVIALSPNTLMATNRFVCEVCSKGFQREQNLQLHRRGHNLPWKLKQKTTKEVKRKVYLCPEPTCVHHHPSRALGDLTGIKKHFSRKHGEKKYKCNKCAKKYAVHSDWKAHTKTCGTREYRCDCGTLFSRRDSFITHRAFCDALAQESARNPPSLGIGASQLFGSSSNSSTMSMDMSQIGSQMSAGQDRDHQNQPKVDMLRLGSARTRVAGQFDDLIGSSTGSAFCPSKSVASSSYFLPESDREDYHLENHSQHEFFSNKTLHHGLMQFSDLQNNSISSAGSSIFNLSIFPSSSNASNLSNNSPNSTSNISSSFLFSNLFNNNHHHHASGSSNGGSSLFSDHLVRQHLSSVAIPSLYSTSIQSHSISPYMSATALLQKAAQLSSTTNNSTVAFLKSFTSAASSSGTKPDPNPISSTQFGGIFSDYNTGNHIYEFMSSITGPSSSIFRPFGRAPHEHDYGYSATKLNFGEQSLRHRSPSFSNLEQASKMQQNLGVRFGGADQGLTRDFLGVGPAGELVRSMSGGGFGQREHGVEIKPLDSERKTAPKSPPFGRGVNFR